ncbi:hypothetical protein TrLO_g4745 [Triparma laevis f. longispina]|uniref:Replication factor C subunit 3 n=1 Tax=Triparma laevis f. longispina TaxID=1714387 RepID=A0A9W7KRJ1_9STRA|nr:hypothetical protein TrLO_g4745 [Triparma laevis f. longispina]
MALWVDKHRPKALQNLDYHNEISERLEAMSNTASLPHLFFFGPSGAGKKTRIQALLKELFGATALKTRLDSRTFETPTKRKIEINMITSSVHIELNPSDAGNYDRYIVQNVIKEIAQNHPLIQNKQVPFKVLIINEVDKLSKQAQAGLRRTMEKYTSVCRIILVGCNQSKVIDPLKSRCLGIRVAAPSIDAIASVLISTGKKESVNVPNELAVQIARMSGRNLRRAILMLESAHTQNPQLDSTVKAPRCDWEEYIVKLAAEVTGEQSPQKLLQAREMLYELLINCIPSSVIMKSLTIELLKNCDDSLKVEVVKWAAFYEGRMNGGKEIFHLEAFVAKFMALYKEYLTNLFG